MSSSHNKEQRTDMGNSRLLLNPFLDIRKMFLRILQNTSPQGRFAPRAYSYTNHWQGSGIRVHDLGLIKFETGRGPSSTWCPNKIQVLGNCKRKKKVWDRQPGASQNFLEDCPVQSSLNSSSQLKTNKTKPQYVQNRTHDSHQNGLFQCSISLECTTIPAAQAKNRSHHNLSFSLNTHIYLMHYQVLLIQPPKQLLNLWIFSPPLQPFKFKSLSSTLVWSSATIFCLVSLHPIWPASNLVLHSAARIAFSNTSLGLKFAFHCF